MPTTQRQPTSTLARDLAARLRKRIQQADLEDGELFMTEGEVAAEYEVSRTVAREAVGQLKALGILEGRKRKGLVVRRPDPLKLLTETLPSLSNSESDWRELGMLRYALEVGAIELAVQNATQQQISRLAEIADRIERHYRESRLQEAIEADVEFHGLILQMTGSHMIAGMQQVLSDYFHRVPVLRTDAASVERIIWEHRELYNAIRDRDTERARTMIRLQLQAAPIQGRRGAALPRFPSWAGETRPRGR